MSIAKSLVQLLATILAAIVPGLIAGPMDTAAWINVVILAAGAVMVYNASNDIPGWNYAKLVASAVSAVAVLLVSYLSDGISTAEWIQLGLAALAALGVGAKANAPQPMRG